MVRAKDIRESLETPTKQCCHVHAVVTAGFSLWNLANVYWLQVFSCINGGLNAHNGGCLMSAFSLQALQTASPEIVHFDIDIESNQYCCFCPASVQVLY
ncbi:hypothetical protein KQX54_008729 [Cotesia glomerata]|uniref:Uncharacterized protein n=1 Tax=Cotesia glomerata TaxID=32391 RepID=A0AAV7HJ63_COTGL|nr:hypothetical protein KQX54_008729 [Cotesia glomerata]